MMAPLYDPALFMAPFISRTSARPQPIGSRRPDRAADLAKPTDRHACRKLKNRFVRQGK